MNIGDVVTWAGLSATVAALALSIVRLVTWGREQLDSRAEQDIVRFAKEVLDTENLEPPKREYWTRVLHSTLALIEAKRAYPMYRRWPNAPFWVLIVSLMVVQGVSLPILVARNEWSWWKLFVGWPASVFGPAVVVAFVFASFLHTTEKLMTVLSNFQQMAGHSPRLRGWLRRAWFYVSGFSALGLFYSCGVLIGVEYVGRFIHDPAPLPEWLVVLVGVVGATSFFGVLAAAAIWALCEPDAWHRSDFPGCGSRLS